MIFKSLDTAKSHLFSQSLQRHNLIDAVEQFVDRDAAIAAQKESRRLLAEFMADTDSVEKGIDYKNFGLKNDAAIALADAIEDIDKFEVTERAFEQGKIILAKGQYICSEDDINVQSPAGFPIASNVIAITTKDGGRVYSKRYGFYDNEYSARRSGFKFMRKLSCEF